jgi:hypothetical protein
MGSGSRKSEVVPEKETKSRNFMLEEFSVGLEASPGACIPM